MTVSRRMIAAVLTLGALVACAPDRADVAGTDTPVAAAPRPVGSADEATLLVRAAIRSHRLTALADECLQFSVSTPDPATFAVEVRENHRRTECGGDPQTAPRLFDVRVDRATAAMTTNANGDAAVFRALPPSP